MNVLISWSGGLDSTYLVWKALSEGHTVHTYSVEILNNKDQSAREGASRKKMKEYFDKKFPGKLHIEHTPGVSQFGCQGSRLTLSQPALWILFSFYAVPISEIDEVWIGYVMNDDALSYIDDIRDLYNAYKPFHENSKMPNLVFPITKKRKFSLIGEMPDKLLSMISVCEGPFTKEECGHCMSCEKNEEAFKNSSKYHLCRSKKPAYSDVTAEVSKKPLNSVGVQGVLFPEYDFHNN